MCDESARQAVFKGAPEVFEGHEKGTVSSGVQLLI